MVLGQMACGLFFLIFGLNGFFKIIPIPRGTDQFENLVSGLMSARPLMALVKWTEIVSGLLLLTRWEDFLGFIFLGPIVLTVAVMQFSLNRPKGNAITFMMLALYAMTAWSQWDKIFQFFVLDA